MKKYILLMFCLLLCFNFVNARRPANRAGGRNNRRGSSFNTNISGTINTVAATVADTQTIQDNFDNPAPTTDSTAQRRCYKYVANKLKEHCENNSCTNATEVYANLEFPVIEPDKNDNKRKEINEIYCTNFIETAVNKLWDSYDAYANNEEKNCNIALARTMAAEACYRYALTQQNRRKGEFLVTDEQKKEKFESICGKSQVVKYYKKITKSDIGVGEVGEDDIYKYFISVGNIGVSNIGAYVDRLISLKFDFKTNEYPRELVQLVNSLKSEGNMMCGEKNYSELYDTNFQLFDKTGALGKAIDNKGILAGSRDYFVDNTVGVFSGTDKADAIKKGKKENPTPTPNPGSGGSGEK